MGEEKMGKCDGCWWGRLGASRGQKRVNVVKILEKRKNLGGFQMDHDNLQVGQVG